jgi:hypothetical protein
MTSLHPPADEYDEFYDDVGKIYDEAIKRASEWTITGDNGHIFMDINFL